MCRYLTAEKKIAKENQEQSKVEGAKEGLCPAADVEMCKLQQSKVEEK